MTVDKSSYFPEILGSIPPVGYSVLIRVADGWRSDRVDEFQRYLNTKYDNKRVDIPWTARHGFRVREAGMVGGSLGPGALRGHTQYQKSKS